MNFAVAAGRLEVMDRDEKESLRRATVQLKNGRVVSLTLADPNIKRELKATQAKTQEQVDALRAQYIKAGFLTPRGKLTKRYGG